MWYTVVVNRELGKMYKGTIAFYFKVLFKQMFGGKKAKLSLCLINYARCHEDIWGSGGTVPPFLTWALGAGKWSPSRSGHFKPGEGPKPVWTLWRTENLASSEIRTPVV
jgi:hypothetical protein